jgi:hypothetical protein
MNLHGETSCPEAVLSAIAWYPDALDDEARGLVETHAASCAECREELAFVLGRVEPELPLPDPEQVYAGVLARIERDEAGRERSRVPGAPPGLAPGSGRAPRRRRRMASSRPTVLAAGIALAVLCTAIGALGGLLLATSSVPSYETVEEIAVGEGVAGPAAGAMLDVVFRADVRAEQVHAALRAIGAQIVSGPTQIGVYQVRLAEGADVAAAAKLLEGEGRGVAAFAQPTR